MIDDLVERADKMAETQAAYLEPGKNAGDTLYGQLAACIRDLREKLRIAEAVTENSKRAHEMMFGSKEP